MFGFKTKKLAVQAKILDAGKLNGSLTRLRGFAYGTFDYQVELSLPGETECRAIAGGLACSACRPEPGDIIDVSFDPKKRTATFELDGIERYDPVVVSKQLIDTAKESEELYSRLEDAGVLGMASVVAVRHGRHRFSSVEVQSDVRVKAGPGDEFDATVVEWLSEQFPEFFPKVGEERRVRFDPRQRSSVVWWDDEELTWRVPVTCPQCGAPVDQSTASRAEHPTCDFCHSPLPCERE